MLSLRLRPDTELHSPHRQLHIPTKHTHWEIVKQVRDYIKQLNHMSHKHPSNLTWIIFIMFIIEYLTKKQQYITQLLAIFILNVLF